MTLINCVPDDLGSLSVSLKRSGDRFMNCVYEDLQQKKAILQQVADFITNIRNRITELHIQIDSNRREINICHSEIRRYERMISSERASDSENVNYAAIALYESHIARNEIRIRELEKDIQECEVLIKQLQKILELMVNEQQILIQIMEKDDTCRNNAEQVVSGILPDACKTLDNYAASLANQKKKFLRDFSSI